MNHAVNAIRPNKGGHMKIVIDRIEKDLAVCETNDRKIINIPVRLFPSVPISGEVYEKAGDKLTYLPEETDEKRRTIENRFSKLVKGRNHSN